MLLLDFDPGNPFFDWLSCNAVFGISFQDTLVQMEIINFGPRKGAIGEGNFPLDKQLRVRVFSSCCFCSYPNKPINLTSNLLEGVMKRNYQKVAI